eukprot:scaffold704_cov347-Prasinococcus_capsulatus_cf.AAC.6
MTSVRATLPASLNKSLRPCHCMLHGKLWTTTWQCAADAGVQNSTRLYRDIADFIDVPSLNHRTHD